jgi:hypothetical protein
MSCALCAALISSNAALAQQMNADDLKWINECIRDNRDEPGGTPAIIRAYCVCMNEKMDDNETRSIRSGRRPTLARGEIANGRPAGNSGP